MLTRFCILGVANFQVGHFAMTAPYVAPARDNAAFNCPFCRVFAQQRWTTLVFQNAESNFQSGDNRKFGSSECMHCHRHAIWHNKSLIHPRIIAAPAPNDDLPHEVVVDFEEARQIAELSPRGAAALLRLALQKLCELLGGQGKNLNDDIAWLVREKGLSKVIQQSLDSIRVIGNNAVHPGQLDLEDDLPTVTALFQLINLVADALITQPTHVQAVYDILPQAAKDAIAKRDEL